MTDVLTLNVFLYDQLVGTLTRLPDDRNLFAFDKDYADDPKRPTLSLSFKDQIGELITPNRASRTRLPPFFSNLLPEGPLRDYLASQSNVSAKREFFLLWALGRDLPGAIKVLPDDSLKGKFKDYRSQFAKERKTVEPPRLLRFSLAGVQLKFSALESLDGRLTIAGDGVGGSWILKLPSPQYPGLPENEYSMMELARRLGMDVPEVELVSLDAIEGLPDEMKGFGNHALQVRRFDRQEGGQAVHMEDFAQIFGVYPEKKYDRANYRSIVKVISAELDEAGVTEFIRRFVFNALIGNGDMHLKNWALLYPEKDRPRLAPAYDFVSTIPYLPDDRLALNFMGSKAFESLSLQQFGLFARKAGLGEALVLETVSSTLRDFRRAWADAGSLPIQPNALAVIGDHLTDLPLYSQLS